MLKSCKIIVCYLPQNAFIYYVRRNGSVKRIIEGKYRVNGTDKKDRAESGLEPKPFRTKLARRRRS